MTSIQSRSDNIPNSPEQTAEIVPEIDHDYIGDFVDNFQPEDNQTEPVSMDGMSGVDVTEPNSPCYLRCPIVQHGISEIISETDPATVKSIVRWLNNVRDKCTAGPQIEYGRKLSTLGKIARTTSCGSHIANSFSDINKSTEVHKN